MSARESRDPMAGTPRARAIRGLCEDIQHGLWQPPARLPSEDKLAARYGICRSTMRAALGDLVRQKILVHRRSQGYTVRSSEPATGGLMSRTVVVLSNMPGQPQRRLFSGDEIAVESGLMDTVLEAGLNAFSLHVGQFDNAGIAGLLADRPQGVAVTCLLDDPERQVSLIRRLAQDGLPVVVYGDTPELRRFDRVASDHARGTHDLICALARQGHRRILRLWTLEPGVPWLRAHNAGYIKAARACGLPALPVVQASGMPLRVIGSRSVFDQRVRHLAGFLAEHLSVPGRVDAVMVATDCELYPLAAACRLFGREPGRDLALVGYDNYWPHAFERAWVPCTPFATVEKHNHQVGEAMARLLLDREAGRLPRAPQCRVIPQEVVIPSP